jgi:hypothetical protein
MAYLVPSEYTQYCGSDVIVTDTAVAYASGLIDAIIGHTLEPFTEPQLVQLKKDKGKLKHTPVIEVMSIYGVNITPTGVNESELPINSIYITDEYGRFQFFQGASLSSVIWGSPTHLRITYKHGYIDIPEDIKIICGSIAKNIAKVDEIGGISGAKSITSLDFSIAMFDDRLFSSNELLVLQKYKEV